MKEKYNFSWKHWLTIFICFLLFLLANAVTSDSENVVLPLLADDNGWDYYGRVLTIVTIAGCLSVFGNIALGKLCEKVGPRIQIVISLIATAFFVFLYGTSTSYVVLMIGLIGTVCCGQSISYLGANAIIANWFPRKKGLAMGFVTVGPPVATVVMVSALTAVISAFGTRGGIFTIVGVLLVMAVLCFVFVRDTPEQVGALPDNMPLDPAEPGVGEDTDLGPTMTFGQMLKNKNLWFIMIITGICSISQTGLMAQWIVRYNDTAFESKAGLMMSICAVVGIFGSMLAGYLENRLGTKKSYAFLAIWFALALVLNFTGITALVWISVVMFGLIITLFQIYMPVFELSVFGRENFRQANAIIFPIVSLCGQLTFLVIAACKSAFGEVKYAYLVFAILMAVSVIFSFALKFRKEPQA